MEKKEKRFWDYKSIQSQYEPLVDGCRVASKMAEPLVYNLNIIYNLNNIYLPHWKYLTKIQKMAVFFEYVVDEGWLTVTLRFSDEFILRCLASEKVTDFIRRRINQNFKNRLGFVPDYLFSVEFENKQFHLHGVISSKNYLKDIIKILKTTAFGSKYSSNPIPERNKICTEPIYDKFGWLNYILKTYLESGFDLYVKRQVEQKTQDIYNEIYRGFKQKCRRK